jgi:hypothetical protein
MEERAIVKGVYMVERKQFNGNRNVNDVVCEVSDSDFHGRRESAVLGEFENSKTVLYLQKKGSF